MKILLRLIATLPPVNSYFIGCFFRLTSREKKDREHKKELLRIAKDHEKARELENVQRYHMPRDLKKGEKGKISSAPLT